MICFSVVIPLYNKERSIIRTIESVLAQTLCRFELIVVDDGSTDNSASVIRKIEDSRIRIIDKPNGGVASARNKGIEEATNEWIVLIDGDDYWLPNHLENLAKAIRMFPNKKCFYTGYTTDRTNDFSLFSSKFAFVVSNYYALALEGHGMCSSCVCIHSSVFREGFMFRVGLTHGEDLDLWRRIVKAFEIVVVPRVTAVYSMGSENRAVRKIANPRKTIIWDLDFTLISDEQEERYFRNIYYGFLYSYFPKNICYFWTLCARKHFWKMGGFLCFVFMFNWNRLARRFFQK